jgi:hypothetical protein
MSKAIPQPVRRFDVVARPAGPILYSIAVRRSRKGGTGPRFPGGMRDPTAVACPVAKRSAYPGSRRAHPSHRGARGPVTPPARPTPRSVRLLVVVSHPPGPRDGSPITESWPRTLAHSTRFQIGGPQARHAIAAGLAGHEDDPGAPDPIRAGREVTPPRLAPGSSTHPLPKESR